MVEVFKTDHFAEVSLSDWLTHTPPQMIMDTLNISAADLARFPNNRPDILPI
jgi:oxalate decarboxylase